MKRKDKGRKWNEVNEHISSLKDDARNIFNLKRIIIYSIIFCRQKALKRWWQMGSRCFSLQGNLFWRDKRSKRIHSPSSQSFFGFIQGDSKPWTFSRVFFWIMGNISNNSNRMNTLLFILMWLVKRPFQRVSPFRQRNLFHQRGVSNECRTESHRVCSDWTAAHRAVSPSGTCRGWQEALLRASASCG